VGILAWLFGRKKRPEPTPLPRPTSPAAAQGPAAGTAAYWHALDADAVNRYTSANIRRLEASRRGDVVAAADAQREYDVWFAKHREYRANELAAEARERT